MCGRHQRMHINNVPSPRMLKVCIKLLKSMYVCNRYLDLHVDLPVPDVPEKLHMAVQMGVWPSFRRFVAERTKRIAQCNSLLHAPNAAHALRRCSWRTRGCLH